MQVGSGERGSKIRTYNFRENRVTDHRIGLTLYNLDKILEGQLDPFFSQRYALARLQQYRRGLDTDRLGIFSLTGYDNISNTRKIDKVYLRGVEVDRAALRARWQARRKSPTTN